MESCLMCNQSAVTTRQDNSSRTIYNCDKCGVYVISDLVQDSVKRHIPEISAYLQRRRLADIDDAILISFDKATLDKGYTQLTVEQIVARFPTVFSERMENALLNLALLSEYPGKEIVVDNLISAAPIFYLKTVNFDALSFMIKAMMQAGLVEVNYRGSSFFPCGVIVSPKGWDLLSGLERKNENARPKALLICQHSAEAPAKTLRAAAQKSAKECGVQLIAEDTLKLGGTYCSIDALIKTSKYILIDMSDPCPESLYALGYARALQKQFILICHEERRKTLSIDSSKIAVTFWRDEKQLYLELFNFIKASE